MLSKKTKYLGIHLAKICKIFILKNHKILMREIEDLNKWWTYHVQEVEEWIFKIISSPQTSL